MSEQDFERQASELSRWDFLLKIGGGAAAAAILASCGKPDDLFLPPESRIEPVTATFESSTTITSSPTTTVFETVPTTLPTGPTSTVKQGSINSGATIDNPSERKVTRGTQLQVTDTLPPPINPKSWMDGAFINYVELPDGLNGFAFTIDDGPSPYNTDKILFALEKHGIKATFFLIGVNIRAWPEIARRIRDAGHEIGNHSVYHDPYIALSLAQQIAPNQQIIFDETGIWAVANRTPGLTRGQIILDTCLQLGMYELHTTLNQNDWRSPRWSESRLIAEAIREYIRGGFSLNHDGGGLRPTSSAFEDLIQVALNKDLQCFTATEMINRGVPKPGGNSYSNVASFRRAQDVSVDKCNYNPEKELKHRLKDPKVKRAERGRIVEVLADIEKVKKEK